MKIENLKDVKSALADIPDDVLSHLGFGNLEENEKVSLLFWGTGDKIESEEDKGYTDDPELGAIHFFDKYPKIDSIDKWIRKILEAQDKLNKEMPDENMEEPISSED